MSLNLETWKDVVQKKSVQSAEFKGLDAAVRAHLAELANPQRQALLVEKWLAWKTKLKAQNKTYQRSARYVANGALEDLERLCLPALPVRVYLSGHGFMWTRTGDVPNHVSLKFKMVTYVPEDFLFDGKCLKDLLDDGAISAAKFELLPQGSKPELMAAGTQTVEYLLCSDRDTATDYTNALRYATRPQGDQPVQFKGGLGTLVRLDAGAYVFTTADKTLTRLSDIQDQLSTLFLVSDREHKRTSDLTLHWAACRTYVTSATYENLLAVTRSGGVRVVGLAGADMAHEDVDSLGGTPVTEIEEAIKGAFAAEVCDCVVHVITADETITIVLPMPTEQPNSILTSPGEFFSRLRSGMATLSVNYKLVQKKGLLVLPRALRVVQRIDRKDAISKAIGPMKGQVGWTGKGPKVAKVAAH